MGPFLTAYDTMDSASRTFCALFRTPARQRQMRESTERYLEKVSLSPQPPFLTPCTTRRGSAIHFRKQSMDTQES